MEKYIVDIMYSPMGRILAGCVLLLWIVMILAFFKAMRITKERNRIGKRAPKIQGQLFHGEVNCYKEQQTINYSPKRAYIPTDEDIYRGECERINPHNIRNLWKSIGAPFSPYDIEVEDCQRDIGGQYDIEL